jgi:hypothetical protein
VTEAETASSAARAAARRACSSARTAAAARSVAAAWAAARSDAACAASSCSASASSARARSCAARTSAGLRAQLRAEGLGLLLQPLRLGRLLRDRVEQRAVDLHGGAGAALDEPLQAGSSEAAHPVRDRVAGGAHVDLSHPGVQPGLGPVLLAGQPVDPHPQPPVAGRRGLEVGGERLRPGGGRGELGLQRGQLRSRRRTRVAAGAADVATTTVATRATRCREGTEGDRQARGAA